MKKFRTLSKAKEDLEALKTYISLIENYTPQTLKQHAIYQYTQEGNILRTAENLNQLGYTIDGWTIEGKDITAIIKSKPDLGDLIHQEIRKLHMKKVRRPSQSSYRW